MNFNEYRPLALRTAKMFPTQRENLRHAALGLITEIGEFTTEVKRQVIYGKPMNDQMWAHMVEEIGDTYWYLPLAFSAIGADPLPANRVVDKDLMLTDVADIGDVPLCIHITAAALTGAMMTDSVESERVFLIEMLSALIVLLDHVCVKFLNIDPGEVRAQNIGKLRKRFPEAYSDQAAEARADKGGLDARVS